MFSGLITFTVTIEVAPYKFSDVRFSADSPSEARSLVTQEYGEDVRITSITWSSDSEG